MTRFFSKSIKDLCFAAVVLGSVSLLACKPSDITASPTGETRAISAIRQTLSNDELSECRRTSKSAAPEFSISPNGKYLVTVDREQYDPPHGRYVKDGVSYNGLKVLKVWEITKDKNLPKSFRRLILSSSRKHTIGYAWGRDNKLYYKGLNYTKAEGRPYLTGYDPAEDTEFTFKSLVDGVYDKDRNDFEAFKSVFKYLEGQTSFNQDRLEGLTFALGQTDWRPNAYGEVTIGLDKDRKTEIEVVQFSTSPSMKPYTTFLKDEGEPDLSYRRNKTARAPHPSRAGWEFSEKALPLDVMEVFTPHHFRTSENRESFPLLEDRGISHLYYLSNVDRNYVGLFRYDDTEATRGHSSLFAPDADITHVSFNRDEAKPYWAVTEEGFPKYQIFNETAKTLFDLIDIPEPHKSEILSIDAQERMAVVKRVSPQRGYEYVLVDIPAKETVLLDSCPGAAKMPWADVSELQFTASDGEDVWGYIYKPLNQETGLRTIIYAHGGPSARDFMSADRLLFKSLVERGYAVITVNYRGSIGYGRDFREAGWKNFSRSRLDLIEAADFAIVSNLADPKKLAVMGNSYGGFLSLSMTLEGATPFEAAISRNGVSNIVSLLETEFLRTDGRVQKYDETSYVYGNVKDPMDRALLSANSALENFDTISMPIFLAHAVEDNRVPARQSKRLYEAVLNGPSDIRIEYQALEGGHSISSVNVLEDYIDGVDRFLDEIFED